MLVGKGEESITGEDRHVDAEKGVVGGPATAESSGVHAREVIVDERSGVDHLERAGSGESSVPAIMTGDEIEGGDAHNGGRALGAAGKDRVSHSFMNAERVAERDGGVEAGVNGGDEGGPVMAEIERRRGRGRGGGGGRGAVDREGTERGMEFGKERGHFGKRDGGDGEGHLNRKTMGGGLTDEETFFYYYYY